MASVDTYFQKIYRAPSPIRNNLELENPGRLLLEHRIDVGKRELKVSADILK
ncbi:hypothetical protein EYZ11_013409 [Aspergillus tanneri]|uniref:Uncharacterized protein n=1 Tax=Aspergillus tanneri TaxID=1220188 RepID=A0A4S3IXZ8_9EURO|nr:hypothetical protein EYZ11_013409 [Aspergillus tanneri]